MDAGIERTGMYLQRLRNRLFNTPTHINLCTLYRTIKITEKHLLKNFEKIHQWRKQREEIKGSSGEEPLKRRLLLEIYHMFDSSF